MTVKMAAKPIELHSGQRETQFPFLNSFWHTGKINQGGEHSPEKGVQGCSALNTPFSRLSCRLQDPQLK